MKTTLYWDEGFPLTYWTDGKVWRCWTRDYGWRDSYSNRWTPEHFSKSLTVNNFKEK